MDIDLDQLAAAVLRLPTADRARLAAHLLASLEPASDDVPMSEDWARAWAAEAERRAAELRADPTLAVPADEAFRRVEAALRAAR